MSIGFVGFSDDGRLALVFRFGIAVFVLVMVGVSRWQDGAHWGRPHSSVENLSGMRWVGSLLMWGDLDLSCGWVRQKD